MNYPFCLNTQWQHIAGKGTSCLNKAMALLKFASFSPTDGWECWEVVEVAGKVGKPATHLGQSSPEANKIGSLTTLDKIPGPDLMISLAVCHTFENLVLYL